MKKQVLNQIDIVHIADLLRKICKPNGKNAIYLDDWDDIKVAVDMRKIGIDCTTTNIAGLRRRLIGHLVSKSPIPKSPASIASLEQRVTALERRVTTLEQWAIAPEQRATRRPLILGEEPFRP